jgi:hypothetical protein
MSLLNDFLLEMGKKQNFSADVKYLFEINLFKVSYFEITYQSSKVFHLYSWCELIPSFD